MTIRKTIEDIDIADLALARAKMGRGLFPETLKEIETELIIHSKDGRSDAGFRLNIALSQIGTLAAHFTHDPKENPIARPYGSPDSEKHDAGHAMVQVMTYCALRGIDLQEAVNMALVNLREKDFVKRKAVESNDDLIIGRTAMTGVVRGIACNINKFAHCDPMPTDNQYIVIAPHFQADPRLKRYAGIVTDHGGINCHAAIVAREFGIPCVVGTGDATTRIKDGDIIEINASVDQGQVKKL